MTRRTFHGNDYAFCVGEQLERFVAVYDYTFGPGGKHTLRFTFGPADAWNAVKQNLAANFGMDTDKLEERVRHGRNPTVVTIEFEDDEDRTDADVLSKADMTLLRKLADAVVDALVEM